MKNFIDMPLVIFFCLILICNYPAHGQSRSEAEGLAKCAAVFHLMTALSEVNPPVGKQYSTYGRLASDMADLYIKPLSGHKNSRQALQNMKSSWMEKLARQRVKTIDPILISCTFWAHNLLLHIKKNISVLDSKNKHKIKEMFRAGPTPDVV